MVWDASRAVGERLVELLAPRPGETVLELAAASGDTGFLAAGLLEPGGCLISSDFAPEMVEAGKRHAEELGVGNAEFRVIDGQAIELEDASIDGVLCRWGYMLMPDPAAALSETSRVLRPGGRVAFAVWGRADENPWGSTTTRVLVERRLMPPPDPDAPGPFRLHDVDRLRALVHGAGLDLTSIEDVGVQWRYSSLRGYWETTGDLSHSTSAALGALSDDQASAVRSEVEERLSPYALGEGLVIPGVCRVVLAARRP